jgi:hypothetical protein
VLACLNLANAQLGRAVSSLTTQRNQRRWTSLAYGSPAKTVQAIPSGTARSPASSKATIGPMQISGPATMPVKFNAESRRYFLATDSDTSQPGAQRTCVVGFSRALVTAGLGAVGARRYIVRRC